MWALFGIAWLTGLIDFQTTEQRLAKIEKLLHALPDESLDVFLR